MDKKYVQYATKDKAEKMKTNKNRIEKKIFKK